MLKVVIIGYGEMFTNLIAATLDAGCKIVGVLRNERIKYNPFVRKIKDIFNPSTDYNYIKSYNLPEINETKSVNSDNFRKELLKLNPDIILVGSWGEKFEKATYDIPKIATINAHPSLLPKYRGPNPYYWVIKNCEQESGITFHLMNDEYDKGAILAQEIVKIYPADTGESLKKRTVLTARGVACELLKSLNEDIIIPLQQRENESSYYSYPENLELDFNDSAESVSGMIRGSYPWYKTYFFHDTTPLSPDPNKIYIEKNTTNYLTPGTITEVNYKTKTISIVCGCGKLLKMSNVNLYKDADKPFTVNYFKREINIGDILI